MIADLKLSPGTDTQTGEPIAVPADSDIVIMGGASAGKTVLARQIVQQLRDAGQSVRVLDREDSWGDPDSLTREAREQLDNPADWLIVDGADDGMGLVMPRIPDVPQTRHIREQAEAAQGALVAAISTAKHLVLTHRGYETHMKLPAGVVSRIRQAPIAIQLGQVHTPLTAIAFTDPLAVGAALGRLPERPGDYGMGAVESAGNVHPLTVTRAA